MSRAHVTTVIDAGGRYGLHPTWKGFKGELHYVLFEPDPLEAQRLAAKYHARAAEVFVEPLALAETEKTLRIDLLRNRAMSTSAIRKPVSALFEGERAAEVEIEESLEVQAHSIDGYAARHGLLVDFLKLDTEGTELEIMRGAHRQLTQHVLGVRSEVSFERIFEGKALFGDLHAYMLDCGFYLLNLDYDGRGEYQNEFARMDGRYGILAGTDAVWLRRKPQLFANASGNTGDLALRALKYAAFAFANNAADVAIDILCEARAVSGDGIDALAASALYRHVDAAVHRLFYSLKWVPGQSLRKHEQTYAAIFNKPMKTTHDFMQSLELNPD